MKENEIRMQTHCASCGAAVTTAICPYCGSLTGLTEEDSYNEYPVLDCKSAKLTFFNTVFPLIFTLSFGLAGGILLAVGLAAERFLLLMSLPFLLIGTGAGIFFFRPLPQRVHVSDHAEVAVLLRKISVISLADHGGPMPQMIIAGDIDAVLC